MRKTVFALVLGAAATFALTGCGLVDLTPDNASADAPAAAPPSQVPPPPSEPAPTGPGIRAVDTTLGKIAANAKGYTLYLTTKDGTNPSRPTCYDACADKWPAYPWSADLTIEGIDQKLIGKVQRKDGTYQLTINKWPAYTYSADGPGEWKGHGVGGTWYALTAQGKKAPIPAPAKSSAGGGY